MKMVKSSVIVLAAAMLALSSCGGGKEDTAGNVPEAQFNKVAADVEFDARKSKDKWKYVLELLDKYQDDQDDVEAWLAGKTTDLFSDRASVPVEILGQVNARLFDEEVSTAAVQIAYYTLANFHSEPQGSNQVTAIASLGNHYLKAMEKDSLEKYNALLKSTPAFDTSPALQLIYVNNQANLAIMRGQIFEAMVNYVKSLGLTQPKDSVDLGVLYTNIANLYNKLDYPEKARMYADSVLQRLDVENLSANTLITIGIILSRTRGFEAAEQLFSVALRKATESENPYLLARVQANYGNHKRRLGDFQAALRLMASSDSICNGIGLQFGLMVNRINRAEIYYDQGDFTRASETLKASESDLPKLGSPELEIGFYKLFFKTQDALQDSLLANRYFRKYMDKKQEYFGDLPRSIIAEWELSVERENNTVRSAGLKLELERKSKQFYLIVAVMSTLLFTLSVIHFLRDRKHILARERLNLEKQEMAHELEIKTKELLSDSLKNAAVQNAMDSIGVELDEIVRGLPGTYKPRFSKLRSRLKSDGTQPYLEEFEKRFTGVYEDFYEKLRVVAPDLTPNELKICALLRLNISTKEMAILTNRSVGTVENLRIRIRKKLKLDNQANLQQVLLNL